MFNDFFASVFTQDNGILKSDKTSPKAKDFPDLIFSPDIIVKVLSKLKPTYSVGPDGFCAYFIKQIRSAIAIPLASIFETSFRTGILPKIWLEAIVIPIHKKGNPHSVENYRPISLCSVICKVMETIVNDTLTHFLTENKLIDKNQYGFMKNKSCASQLLHCKNIWTKNLDDRKPIDIIYIDFCKAFDSVVHSKLLLKLKHLGISKTLLTWITSFLSNRKQKVKIQDTLSDYQSVISGVPQGSVLGPTLFLIYINDLTDNIKNSQIYLFADDAKIFNYSENSHLLQTDLDILHKWAQSWQLKINYDKCASLYLGHKNPKHNYTFEDIIIPNTGPSVKDLGIYISQNLSSSIHCLNTASKASRIAALIRKTFVSKNVTLMAKAFTTYVRPILEYSSIVWSPHLIGDINRIENVQRQFTKKILWKNKNFSYSERLQFLNLERLETRRIKFDLLFAYKIIREKSIPFSDYFELAPTRGTRSQNDLKLYIRKANLDCRKYEFANRVAEIWNTLPQNIVDSKTSTNFKKLLTNFDLENFLKGRA